GWWPEPRTQNENPEPRTRTQNPEREPGTRNPEPGTQTLTPVHVDAREAGLQRQLSAGQMAMVAVGGSIGTGLLLGSGAAVQIAGPAAILSFLAAAFINWSVAMALGELACVHPAAGSFGVYGDLYLNQFAGFIARAGYWL